MATACLYVQEDTFLIGCTTEFLVAGVLPDVVKPWADGLRIPLRDIGVRLAKLL